MTTNLSRRTAIAALASTAAASATLTTATAVAAPEQVSAEPSFDPSAARARRTHGRAAAWLRCIKSGLQQCGRRRRSGRLCREWLACSCSTIMCLGERCRRDVMVRRVGAYRNQAITKPRSDRVEAKPGHWNVRIIGSGRGTLPRSGSLVRRRDGVRHEFITALGECRNSNLVRLCQPLPMRNGIFPAFPRRETGCA